MKLLNNFTTSYIKYNKNEQNKEKYKEKSQILPIFEYICLTKNKLFYTRFYNLKSCKFLALFFFKGIINSFDKRFIAWNSNVF